MPSCGCSIVATARVCSTKDWDKLTLASCRSTHVKDITHGVGLGSRVYKEVRFARPPDVITEVARTILTSEVVLR